MPRESAGDRLVRGVGCGRAERVGTVGRRTMREGVQEKSEFRLSKRYHACTRIWGDLRCEFTRGEAGPARALACWWRRRLAAARLWRAPRGERAVKGAVEWGRSLTRVIENSRQNMTEAFGRKVNQKDAIRRKVNRDETGTKPGNENVRSSHIVRRKQCKYATIKVKSVYIAWQVYREWRCKQVSITTLPLASRDILHF